MDFMSTGAMQNGLLIQVNLFDLDEFNCEWKLWKFEFLLARNSPSSGLCLMYKIKMEIAINPFRFWTPFLYETTITMIKT